MKAVILQKVNITCFRSLCVMHVHVYLQALNQGAGLASTRVTCTSSFYNVLYVPHWDSVDDTFKAEVCGLPGCDT